MIDRLDMFRGIKPSGLRWYHWLLAAALVLHLLMMGSLFWGYLDAAFAFTDENPRAYDFFAIYEAGHRALEGDSIYGQLSSAVSLAPYFAAYRYVPAFAYGFGVPMNAIPHWPAYWAWVAFYEVLLVANVCVTWRVAGKGTWGTVGAAMWFVFTPFYVEQYAGQFSFLMATALLFVGIGVARGSQETAGPPWLISLLVKTNSALLAPVFFRLRWWRTLAGGGTPSAQRSVLPMAP
ncbi:MAG: hypothetical protein U1B78_06955 [Dehalococcoidia bacterium]|nr:hypothetical protein [Dehalococcoidia bacterium]